MDEARELDELGQLEEREPNAALDTRERTASRRRAVAATSRRPSRATVAVVAGACLVVGFVAVLVAAGRAPKHAVAAAPTSPRVEGKWIRFSPDFAQKAHIEIAEAKLGSLSPVVTVTGTVDFDPERVAAIGARIAGRVRRIHKFLGDQVRAGEVVVELESAALGKAHANLVSARARATAAVANDTRQARLADQQVASQRDAELAHATAQAAQAEVRAAEQALRAMGDSPGAREIGVLAIPSPINGRVVDLDVSRGQTVEPSTTALRVADLSQVWVELAVFERELGRVRPNDAVEISPQTHPQTVLKGRVAHVADVIDAETRSAHVRVEIDNADGRLRVGQSVTAKIRTQQQRDALLLPREAVTSVDGKPTVFVARDETSVEPRIVVVGSKDGTLVEIREGLTAGERVVVGGVFALKSEVFR